MANTKKSTKNSASKKEKVGASSRATSYTSPKGNIDEDVITIELQSLLTPISIIIGSIIISIAILYGLKNYGGVVAEDNDTTNTIVDLAADNNEVVAPAAAADEFPIVTTNIDDDPILGNKETAKIAIVEFSDYECPFCQQFWSETHSQLVKDYVDTGEVIIVFRDLPLPQLHANAEAAANAANCARDQKGDSGYYDYHDEIFGGSISGVDSLYGFADNLGLDAAKFKSCVDSDKYIDEVNADAADAAAIGINGTPGFVVGILEDNGDVTGVNIGGAYPYSTFAGFLDGYLEEVK